MADSTHDGKESNKTCDEETIIYLSKFGFEIALPEWEAALIAIGLTLLILLTIIGNILVILSVFTYKPLRIVQNFFIISLAIADLTVALLVMPFNVAYTIFGKWNFGIHVCKMWLTSDVLCCTASILNLCAIALDRFWAITDPINYAQKRTLKRVLCMIFGVWVLSLIISSPPLIGWNDWPEEFTNETPCQLTSERGYVIYSSLGSFYIPLLIMSIVYLQIFIATRKRLRERAKASKINTMLSYSAKGQGKQKEEDQDSISSEANQTNHEQEVKNKVNNKFLAAPQVQIAEDSFTDVQENSSSSNNVQKESNEIITKIVETKKPSGGNIVNQFIEEKQKISLSKERRAARTLGIIMGVFVICWLPFFLMYVLLPFCPNCCVTKRVVNIITWLGYINSALNPIIYTIFNLDFRRAFKKLLGLKNNKLLK